MITDITERVLASRLLEQRVSERTRELSTLLEISHEITTTQGLDDILYRILERLKSIVDYRYSAFLVFEDEFWRIRAYWPAGLEKTGELLLSTDEKRTIAQSFEPGKPEFLNPQADDAHKRMSFNRWQSSYRQFFRPMSVHGWGFPCLGKIV